MGVPGFFSWLRRKYPQIVDDSANVACDDEGNACDNLYVGEDSSTTLLVMFRLFLSS